MPPESAGVLADAFGQAALVLDVGPEGGVLLQPQRELRGLDVLTARIAVDIATAAERGTWRRLKACAADACRWVYFDNSPAGRGRWCSMSICGSRAKVRSFRKRKG